MLWRAASVGLGFICSQRSINNASRAPWKAIPAGCAQLLPRGLCLGTERGAMHTAPSRGISHWAPSKIQLKCVPPSAWQGQGHRAAPGVKVPWDGGAIYRGAQ